MPSCCSGFRSHRVCCAYPVFEAAVDVSKQQHSIWLARQVNRCRSRGKPFKGRFRGWREERQATDGHIHSAAIAAPAALAKADERVEAKVGTQVMQKQEQKGAEPTAQAAADLFRQAMEFLAHQEGVGTLVEQITNTVLTERALKHAVEFRPEWRVFAQQLLQIRRTLGRQDCLRVERGDG